MGTNACCFTGHRNIRKEDEDLIRRKIREQVLLLLDQGISTFMVGGAVGFDMLAAEVLLDLREQEGRTLRLVSVLPFLEWRAGWRSEEMDREDRILERSDEISFMDGKIIRRTYLDRDRKMVDHSSVCIAYCTRRNGGTAYTVRYALKKGISVINLAEWDIRQLAKDAEKNG